MKGKSNMAKQPASRAPVRGSLTKRRGMTRWYDPRILVATAVRVAISTIFGQFADKREAIAATNAIEPQPFDSEFDYSSEEGDFWFDFLADTGDGWNSTYAMARLASAPSLRPTGAKEALPQGTVLFLGGDQVYPTASKEAYAERFITPFEEAYSPTGSGPLWTEGSRHLFAIPGNHDWYDGLNAFFGLFCRRRVKPKGGIGLPRAGKIIAGRQTHQTRSYFAVRLPHGWWLWGTDSQLEGYIDQPQIDYFRHVARYWMEPNSKLILMVGQPSWAYVDEKDQHKTPDKVFSNFSYLERIAGVERNDKGKPMGHELKLVLAGDAHHYSRFTEEGRHYVTCGGGGAFLHPTLQLEDRRFNWEFPPPGRAYVRGTTYVRDFSIAQRAPNEEALYPSRAKSRSLAFRNLGFAGVNLAFTAMLLAAYLLFHWVLDTNAQLVGEGSFADELRGKGFLEAACNYWELVFVSPAALILTLLAFAGYYYAADAPNALARLAMGGAHAAWQALIVTSAAILAVNLVPNMHSLIEVAAVAALAAPLSATGYGIYLVVSLLVFKRHWNEAFSSFAYAGFKSMLRMKISPDRSLRLYPIGLDEVPTDTGRPPANPPLKPRLVEGPITIS